jgi:hypothetical protein
VGKSATRYSFVSRLRGFEVVQTDISGLADRGRVKQWSIIA